MLKPQQDRNQLQMISLEAMVDKNSIVRVIDVFVDLFDLEEIGLIFNLRRSISILGISKLIKRLRTAYIFANVLL